MKTRRAFIKQSCAVCAAGLTLGWLTTQLTSCVSALPIVKAENKQGVISVPLSSFDEKINTVIVRNGQLEFDILVVKSGETFHALQMKCTHQDNPLTATASGLFCSVHGSTFDLDGNVTKEPALRALKKYKTELTEDSIVIKVTT